MKRTRYAISAIASMSLTLGYVQKTNWQRRAYWNERQGGTPPGRLRSPGLLSTPSRHGDASVAAEFLWAGRFRIAVPVIFPRSCSGGRASYRQDKVNVFLSNVAEVRLRKRPSAHRRG